MREQGMRKTGVQVNEHFEKMTDNLATNLNFTRLCRCCTAERDLMYDIFCGTCSNAQTYYEVVMECAPVQVFKGDGLTSLVCHECVLILESFVMFRTKCVESESILNHMRYNMMPDKQEMFDLNRVKQDDPILDNIKEESDDIDVTIEPETEFDTSASGKYLELQSYDEIKNESSTVIENRPDTNSQIDNQRLFVNFVDVKEEFVDDDRPYFNTDRNEKSNLNDESFSCKTSFYKRQKIHTGEKPYSCGQCDKLFKFKSNLHRHQKIHSYRYSCDICNKTFQCKSKFGLHQKTHTGEKPYSCDKCDKSYNCKSQLNEHLKLHSGEKPYSCDKCTKSFSIRTLLNRHQTIHTGEKPYSCDRCDKSFNFKWNLVRHQRVHTGEKPFSCDKCDKLFNCKSHLNEHMIIHTNEKPYACDQCDKSFNFKSNFNKHRKQHMAETVLARETIQL